jgi:hypothetical protein
LWNGRDPILKERLFGLTNSESNHGEDVKEYYFYLDSTPTHSYMKYLYKYPQAAFPYADLVYTSRARSRTELEYELIDTGVFDEDRYFDVFVEYAKASAEDILIQITVQNRGPTEAEVHVLPTIWYRNVWSWGRAGDKPKLQQVGNTIKAMSTKLGELYLHIEGSAPVLFTENETNTERIFGLPNSGPYVKDGINNFVVNGRKDAVNPAQIGTKAAAHYRLRVKPGESRAVRLRLSQAGPRGTADPFGDFGEVLERRYQQANEFFENVIPRSLGTDEANVMRQALAGMLWSKVSVRRTTFLRSGVA